MAEDGTVTAADGVPGASTSAQNSPPTPPTKHRGRPNTEETELSIREQAFVAEYVTHFSAKRAAEAVGYAGTDRGVRVTSCRLLAEPHIQRAIHEAMAERFERLGITADRVAKDIDNAANLDIALLFDVDGSLKPVHRMPMSVRRCIVAIEIVKRNLTSGDRVMDRVYKIKLIDKGKMHEILAKYTGLYSDGARDERPQVPAFALPPETPGVSVH